MPTALAQFSWLNGLSVLIPRTWVFTASKSPMRLSKAGMQVLQHDVLAAVLVKADLLQADGLQREIGGGVAHVQRLLVAHSPIPSFGRPNPPRRVMIAERDSVFNARAHRGADRIGIRTGGLRWRAHRRCRVDSRAASAWPRYSAAVTTCPLSQSTRKRAR